MKASTLLKRKTQMRKVSVGEWVPAALHLDVLLPLWVLRGLPSEVPITVSSEAVSELEALDPKTRDEYLDVLTSKRLLSTGWLSRFVSRISSPSLLLKIAPHLGYFERPAVFHRLMQLNSINGIASYLKKWPYHVVRELPPQVAIYLARQRDHQPSWLAEYLGERLLSLYTDEEIVVLLQTQEENEFAQKLMEELER